jgi:protein-tyrosine-phosphatase
MKILFLCRHNLGRSQMARALHNSFSGTNDAISAGTRANTYPEKTLGGFSEETRAMKVMREIGLDLADAPRQQITPDLAQNIDQIVSFLLLDELPEWLRNDPRIQIWQIVNYPAPDFAAVRRQRDEIADKVHKMIK